MPAAPPFDGDHAEDVIIVPSGVIDGIEDIGDGRIADGTDLDEALGL